MYYTFEGIVTACASQHRDVSDVHETPYNSFAPLLTAQFADAGLARFALCLLLCLLYYGVDKSHRMIFNIHGCAVKLSAGPRAECPLLGAQTKHLHHSVEGLPLQNSGFPSRALPVPRMP